MDNSVQHGYFKGSDGTSLFYEKIGKETPLVLCDGLMCEGHVWKYLIGAFKDQFELLHWHYPGHGKSEQPQRFSDLSPQRLSDDLAALLDHHGHKKAVLIGHSLGVQVALETWHRHGDKVEALVLICGSPGNIIRDFHENAILGYLIPLIDFTGRIFPKTLSTMWRNIPSKPLVWMVMNSKEVDRRLMKTADIADYLSRLSHVDFKLALSMLEGAGRHDATKYLRDVDVPVLILAGQRDRFTPPYRSRLMEAAIPGAELMMVPGGTHSLPIEQPDLVNLRIKRFLSESVKL